jgi:hypothetical protein
MEKKRNLWVIPTDKPSRLCLDSKDKLWFAPNSGYTIADGKQNIYITNDEEIKEGDWVYCTERRLFGKVVEIQLAKFISDTSMLYFEINDEEIWCKLFNCKKIILTTDQDLIKDGIQELSERWIEYIVDNPNCNYLEITERKVKKYDGTTLYKIIIPKEKPKKDDLVYFTKGKEYIQQDGVVILAGEKETDGMVIADPKKTRGIGHYSKDWNPKAFKILEEPKHPKVLSESGNELFFDGKAYLIKEEPKEALRKSLKKSLAEKNLKQEIKPQQIWNEEKMEGVKNVIKEEETVEEALKNELEFIHNSVRNFYFDLGFKTGGLIGAKWQQEPEQFFNDDRVKTLEKAIEYLLKKQDD